MGNLTHYLASLHPFALCCLLDGHEPALGVRFRGKHKAQSPKRDRGPQPNAAGAADSA